MITEGELAMLRGSADNPAMRRLAPLCLFVLAFGCKTPEEKACANTVRIIAESGVDNGAAGKSEQQRRRDCLESLGRLRQQQQPEEEQWFAYLRCLTAANDMNAQFECLGPLTGADANSPAAEAGKTP
jgi:hypothetical protein